MTVDIHTTVQHNLYGKGEVTKITGDKIYVLFGKNQRIFPYPDAFEKGYLSAIVSAVTTGKIPQDDSVELSPEEIKHRIMVIKVNQLYEENMAPDALYDVVRGIWKASKERARKTEYVFGVYHSRIVAVYKPTEWYICKEAKDKLPRKDIALTSENENRIFFVDESFEQGLPFDENQKFYIGKSIANFTKIKNSQNPITYLESVSDLPSPINTEDTREIILDASDRVSYKKIYEALNATVGTSYTGWMKATWPNVYTSHPFRIWFPKLAETKNGQLVSAAFDCVNTISDDWNEVIFDDMKDTPEKNGREPYKGVTLIFAKEPQGGPYIFRGAYVDDKEKSGPKHYVSTRVGTKVKLIGQPSENIEILDDFRNKG